MSKKISLDIVKMQQDFIKTLVDLQKKQIETMKPPGLPPMMSPFRNADKPPRIRVPTKKQLASLKKGRQVLQLKQRQEALTK